MDYVLTILVVLQIISAIGMVAFIMLQQGKGADMGASFGAGGSAGSLFGASGSANFLSRTTAILAAVFFLSTLGQAYFSGSVKRFEAAPSSVLETQAPATDPASPAAPATGEATTTPPKGDEAAQAGFSPAAPAEPAVPSGK